MASSLQLIHCFQGRQLAYNRRLNLLLLVNEKTSAVYIQTRTQKSGRYESNPIEGFSLPLNKTIQAVAIEVLELFMVITFGERKSEVVFIDCKKTMCLNCVDLCFEKILCVDYFHNRMELIAGQLNGTMLSFSLRSITKAVQGEGRLLYPTYHLYHRHSYSHNSTPIRDHFQTTSFPSITKIQAQDVPETCLALDAGGGILCLDANSFELLWRAAPESFFAKPVKIFADRHSLNFAIYCESDSSSLSLKRSYGLEYWMVPAYFSNNDHTASFNRFSIPLEDALVTARVERITPELGVFIAVLLRSNVLFIWRLSADSMESKMFLETSMDLPRPPTDYISPSVLSFEALHFIPPSKVCTTSPAGVLLASGGCVMELRLHCVRGDPNYPFPFDRVPAEHMKANAVLNTRRNTDGGAFALKYFDFQKNNDEEDDLKKMLSSGRDDIIDDELSFTATSLPLSLEPLNYSNSSNAFRLSDFFLNSNRDLSPLLICRNPTAVLTPLTRETTDAFESAVSPSLVTSYEVKYLTKYGAQHSEIAPELKAGRVIPQSSCYAARAQSIAISSEVDNSVYLHNILSGRGGLVHPKEWESSLRTKPFILSLMLADIQLMPFHSGNKLRSASNEETLPIQKHKNYTLLCCGSSDGEVLYQITDDAFDVTIAGTFQAFSTPSSAIHCILTVGNSTFPLFNIGVELPANSCDACIVPVPGSLLLTVSKTGDVRVWSPLFSYPNNSGHAALSPEDIFFNMSCDFILVGTIKSGLDIEVAEACIDPTCMTVILSYADGSLAQFAIPGLKEEDNMMKTMEPSSPSVFSRCHSAAITDLRCWTEGGTSSGVSIVTNASLECGMGTESSSYAVLLPGLGQGHHLHIGYTHFQLKQLSITSCLITSSKDLSVVFWTFRLHAKAGQCVLLPIPKRR